MPRVLPDGRFNALFAPLMQAREVPALPRGEDWIYEYLWGGERVRVVKRGDSVHVVARDGRDFTNRFPRIAAGAARLRSETTAIDGEVLYLDGCSDSAVALLDRTSDDHAAPRLALLAGDLLVHGGRDVRHYSLLCRRLMLASAVQGTPLLLAPWCAGNADTAIAGAARLGLRGVVAKRGGSPYRPNSLQNDWVKVTLPSRFRVSIAPEPAWGGRA